MRSLQAEMHALRKELDHISDDEIVGLEIPTGIPYRYVLAEDGSVLEVSLTISPVRNELGEIVGASKVAYPVVPGSARCGMRGGMSRREGGEGAADGEGAIADRVPTSLP